MNTSVKMDTRAFDAAMKQYVEFSKRSLPEIVNTKAYFVARNAVASTGGVDKGKIEQELRATARTGNGPLAALIVNARRGATGQKGLNGPKMSAAINKLVNARKRTVNFLRAGWIPAIKKLESLVPKKSGAASYKGVKIHGAPKGGATVAKPNSTWKSIAEIWNSVSGGTKDAGIQSESNPNRVSAIIQQGLQAAINKEANAMLQYVKKKSEEGLRKLKA
jgi:hypothetical protein